MNKNLSKLDGIADMTSNDRPKNATADTSAGDPADTAAATQPEAEGADSTKPAVPSPRKPKGLHRADQVKRTRAAGMWVGLIVAAIVMVFLLVFIVQNNESVEIKFLAFDFTLPLGVALLLAAISAVLIVAIPGAVRIVQLRRQVRSRSSDGGGVSPT